MEEPEQRNSRLMSRRAFLGTIGGLGAAVIGGGAIYEILTHNNQKPEVAAIESPFALPPEFDVSREIDLMNGQWNYMPGASRTANGLHMRETGLAILQVQPEDDTHPVTSEDYVPNPPFNLYGTHIEIGQNSRGNNDFGAAFRFANVNGEATLICATRPPWELDERRVLQPGLSITVSSTGVTVSSWDTDIWQGEAAWEANGASQASSPEPIHAQQIALETPLSSSGSLDVILEQADRRLTIRVGNQRITVPLRNAFDQMWIGADASTKAGWDLAAIRAYPISIESTVSAVDTSTLRLEQLSPSGLQAYANKKREELGFSPMQIMSAVELTPMVTVPALQQLIAQNFGGITTELDAKWQAFEPQTGVFTPQYTDALVDIARRNNRTVHLHTSGFEEAFPLEIRNLLLDSSVPLATKQELVNDYMQAWAGRYTNSPVKTIDVVDEYFDDNDNPRVGPWTVAFGEEYAPMLFHAAHAANPDALLFYNDYGLENDPERQTLVLQLLEQWLQAGVPIHGVGLECHVFDPSTDTIDPTMMASFFQQVKQLGEKYGIEGGLKIRISEASVDGGNRQYQAEQYSQMMTTALQADNVVAWCTWGALNGPFYFTASPGDPGNDALWNNDKGTAQPNPAVGAVIAAEQNA
jgi:endo-1,4-beta-xylanase